MFCRSFVLLSIVLSVLLRFMDSDYPFGIFKLFFHDRWFLKREEFIYKKKSCDTLNRSHRRELSLIKEVLLQVLLLYCLSVLLQDLFLHCCKKSKKWLVYCLLFIIVSGCWLWLWLWIHWIQSKRSYHATHRKSLCFNDSGYQSSYGSNVCWTNSK